VPEERNIASLYLIRAAGAGHAATQTVTLAR
jgi:hypothetical protein